MVMSMSISRMWMSAAAAAAAMLCLTAAAAVAAPRSTEASPPVKVAFDAESGRVTLTLAADDVVDNVTTGLRREQLQVLENGVRQRDVRVDVQHAPVSVAVLIEMGGRSRELNEMLRAETPYLVRPIVDRLGPQDKLALFTYDNSLHDMIAFDTPSKDWNAVLGRLAPPPFSEANFYDAAIATINRMQSLSGRRAIVLLTTGIDTFSRATFDDVLARAQAAQVPIYCLPLGSLAQTRVVNASAGPLSRVNWSELDARLARLAEVSGGRIYRDVSSFNMPGIADDMLERLRVEYVLSYIAAPGSATGDARVVEVRVTDRAGDRTTVGRTSGTNERPKARVLVQTSYSPADAISRSAPMERSRVAS